ncbi:RE endonuclease [Aeromonas phage ST4]|nr:RE endonuclease [Aeromonas phage ST4]
MNAPVKDLHGEVVDGAQFFAPVSADMVDGLIGRYKAMRANIETVAQFIHGGDNASAIGYFLRGNQDGERYIRAVPDIFKLEGAVAQLNADYWQQAMQLTDVYDYMPAKRRDEWNEQIREKQTPDFEEDTVRSTLMDLLASRTKFFGERVDGIFRALSGEHVTNRPEGFGKRMILSRVFNEYGHTNHGMAGYISDLRQIISKFMGRDEPKWFVTNDALQEARARHGEWLTLDGGAMRVRAYLKGTAHLEVHPEMAWRLNCVLASLYPMAIPPQFRQKPKRHVKDFVMVSNPLPFSVLGDLAGMKPERHTAYIRDRWSDPVQPATTNPFNRRFDYGEHDKAVRAKSREVLKSIGGVPMMRGKHGNIEIWEFDYDPSRVIGEIVASGCIPDHKSHQYYPTPERLALLAVEMAEIEEGHDCLEPSAGQGGIADHMPMNQTVCIELSKLHCEILKAKGHNVIEADFLKFKRDDWYHRIVMNPPFSEGRWQAHVEHAASMLRKTGRLVAILPASAKNKFKLEGFTCEWSQVFDNEFDGASVSVVILKADRIN